MGKLEGYKAARDIGVKVRKEWMCDAEACEECLEMRMLAQSAWMKSFRAVISLNPLTLAVSA